MLKFIKSGLPIIVIMLVIAYLLFIFLPRSFDVNTINEKISITYMKSEVENGQAVNNSKSFEFLPEESHYQNIVEILNQYSYHASFRTLFSDGSIHGNTETFIFSLGYNGNSMVLANGPDIIIGTKTYKVGYWGDTKILELLKELKTTLGIE